MGEFGDLENLIKKGSKIFNLAIRLGAEKHYLESIRIYEEILSIAPNLSNIINNLGIAFSKIGNNEEATRLFTRALESNNGDSDELKSLIFYNRAITYHSLENYDEAIKDYKKSIELNKDSFLAYNGMGSLKDGLEEYFEAIKIYKKALKFCDDKEYAKVIKNNIKNSNENMEKFLRIMAYDSRDGLDYLN